MRSLLSLLGRLKIDLGDLKPEIVRIESLKQEICTFPSEISGEGGGGVDTFQQRTKLTAVTNAHQREFPITGGGILIRAHHGP